MQAIREQPKAKSNLDVRIIGISSVIISFIAFIAELNPVAPVIMCAIGIAGIIPIPQIYGKKD